MPPGACDARATPGFFPFFFFFCRVEIIFIFVRPVFVVNPDPLCADIPRPGQGDPVLYIHTYNPTRTRIYIRENTTTYVRKQVAHYSGGSSSSSSSGSPLTVGSHGPPAFSYTHTSIPYTKRTLPSRVHGHAVPPGKEVQKKKEKKRSNNTYTCSQCVQE